MASTNFIAGSQGKQGGRGLPPSLEKPVAQYQVSRQVEAKRVACACDGVRRDSRKMEAEEQTGNGWRRWWNRSAFRCYSSAIQDFLQCMNHLRQMMLAWYQYALDHDDHLVPNEWYTSYGGWVRGIMDFNPANPHNTNVLYLTDPRYAALAPYTQSAAVYKCPADRSAVRIGSRAHPRVRSVAMNHAQGARPGGGSVTAQLLTHPPYRVYAKLGEIIDPPPSQLWVIVDEHPDSINNGGMAVQCTGRGPQARIIDYPASFHNGACGFSFADGHSEIRRWVDARTMPQVRYNNAVEPALAPEEATWVDGILLARPGAEIDLLARQIPPRDASIRHAAMPDPAPGVMASGNRSWRGPWEGS